MHILTSSPLSSLLFTMLVNLSVLHFGAQLWRVEAMWHTDKSSKMYISMCNLNSLEVHAIC